MTEPEKMQEQTNEPMAPANWKDIVRQHVTGPVFSLAFHIFLLVLLGTIVIIVPNAVKDDIDPVQISEMEPVLPPPEEEPMPSDMTVMDTSSPSLDRYESDAREMEEVGVTDVPVMTDIEIPTPLIVPDSNSALKLQVVSPFGRPGGGDMGDGGEGDGRGNLKGMLQGVFYDLKQTKTGRPTESMGDPNNRNDLSRDNGSMPVLKEFVDGTWRREYDDQGRVHYPALDKFYCSSTRLWNSCFYTKQIPAEDAPEAFQCGKEVKLGAWVCIYSGNVVAPFSGKFRFVGFGDDILVVRFNKKIVFDYGWRSATLGICLNYLGEGFNGYLDALNGKPKNERERRMIADSVIYSKHNLDVYYPGFDSNHGIAKGPVLEVQEGEVYPIEVLISEIPGGNFSMLLFVEQLDDNGEPLEELDDSSRPMWQQDDNAPSQRKKTDMLTLFRTTLDLPEYPADQPGFPRFKPYGPIWRVVRSDESQSNSPIAGRGRTDTSKNSSIVIRREPPKEFISEDDDDLSL